MRTFGPALLLGAGLLVVPALATAGPEVPACGVPIRTASCPSQGSRTYVCGEIFLEACTYE